MEALKPANEAARLAALHRYEVLDSPAEAAFDRIVAAAARIFQVPIAMVTLIDRDRQWMKACYGIDVREMDRRITFCAHTILSPEITVAPDARLDPRFQDFPHVTGPPFVRFYAGAPLIAADGLILGALCLIDFEPRDLTEGERATLTDLAACVVSEFDHRLDARRLREEFARREEAERELERRVVARTAELAAANDALRIAEAKARAVIEHAVEGVFQTTPEGRYLTANPALVQLYGYDSAEQFISAIQSIEGQIYVDPASRAEFLRRMDSEGVVQGFEAEVYRRDRSTIWIAETARAVRDGSGRLLYFEGMVKDISARKRAERALQEAKDSLERRVGERTAALEQINGELRAEIDERHRVEEELRRTAAENSRLLAAVQNSDAGLLISDPTQPDAPTIFVNAAFERVTGYRAEEVLGKNCRFLQGPATDRAMVDQIRQAVAERRPFKGLLLNYRKDGTPFWNELTLNPVFGAGGELVNFVGIQSDVTARVEAAQALSAAKIEAERANHAKSDFLSRMSHELRTPLNAILGFSQLLETGPLPASERENVELISRAGRHLLDLINEVLDLASIEAGRVVLNPEPVNVAEVLDDAFTLLRTESERRQVSMLRAEAPQSGWHVLADRQRLKQILLNLLSNALKYNRRGGSVTVRCETIANGRLAIAVADTGPGLSPSQLAKMFVPFERLGAEYSQVQGTGIGLVLSRRLARLQGGDLEAESTVGQGSTFVLRLPKVEKKAEPRSDAPEESFRAAAPRREGRCRLLYIEDNDANLQLMGKIVGRDPRWTMLSATTGQTGIELARQHCPELVLLDLHLPDFNGDRVLERLRAEPALAAVPVVIVSADAMSRQVQRLLDAGASAYVTKPIVVTEMLKLLDAYAAEREPAVMAG